MAEYDDLLNAAIGPASGGVNQDYESLLGQATGNSQQVEQQQAKALPLVSKQAAAVASQASSQPVPQPESDAQESYESLLDQAGPVPASGYWDVLSGGFQRGVAGFQAMPSQIEAIGHELAGNYDAMLEAAGRAQEIEKAAPQQKWQLENVNGISDFSYWLTERLGEQVPNLLAMAAGGGAGTLVARLAARNLMMSTTSRAALLRAGGISGGLAAITPLEIAGTSGEQFEVSSAQGSPTTQPLMSIGAGLAKGMFEIYTPMRITHALLTPGKQLGKTALGAAGNVAVGEALTEGVQEGIDIALRKYSDPSYSFFGEGPTYMGPGAWRLAESMLAGGLIGGGMGAISGFAEGKIDPKQPRQPRPGTFPGEMVGSRDLQPANMNSYPIGQGWTRTPWDTPGEAPPMGIELWAKRHLRDRGSTALTTHAEDEAIEVYRTGNYSSALEAYKSYLDWSKNYNLTFDKFIDGLHKEKIGTRWNANTKELEIYGVLKRKAPAELRSLPVRPGVGIVSEMRTMLMPRGGADRSLKEVTQPTPKEDMLVANPLMRSIPESSREAQLDWIEANTPRYAVPDSNGGFLPIMWNPTDFVHETAGFWPQGQKPEVLLVDQGSLQPAGVSATIMDLPPLSSNRVWFLPGTDEFEQSRALRTYAWMQREVESDRATVLFNVAEARSVYERWYPVYSELMTKGLRVIPSRGSSFVYNLGFRGDPAQPEASYRSPPGLWIRDLGLLDTQLFDELGEIPSTDLVSLDFDKVADHEWGVLPLRTRKGNIEYGNAAFRDDLTDAEIDQLQTLAEDIVPLNGDWDKERVARLRELMRKGLKWNYAPNSFIVTTKPIEPLLVPGHADSTFSTDIMRMEAGFKPETTIERVFETMDDPIAEELETKLQRMKPVVDAVLKSVGIDGGVNIRILDTDGMAPALAYIYPPAGQITFLANDWAQEGDTSTVKVFNALMHELGHAITFYYFNKLPFEMQLKLKYAYDKNLSTRRVAKGQWQQQTGMANTDIENISALDYFTSFAEWLAEQFRRSTYTVPLTELDGSFHDIAQKLERFYKAWEDRFPAQTVRNLFEPDYNFSAVMEYLRNFGSEKDAVKQRARQSILYALGSDVKLSPGNVQIYNAVFDGLESIKHMFPAYGLTVQVREQGTEEDILAATHRFDDGLVMMELAAGALPQEDLQGETRIRIAHELVHAYRMLGLITDGEISVLYRAALKEGLVLDPALRAAYVRQVREEGKRYKWDATTTDIRIQQVIREETVAFYIQQYANRGSAISEAKTLLDRFLLVLDQIRNFLKGYGFHTRDDVIRAFFSGEMANRTNAAQVERKRQDAFMRSLETNMAEFIEMPEAVTEVAPGTYMVVEKVHVDDTQTSYIFQFYIPNLDVISDMPQLSMVERSDALQGNARRGDQYVKFLGQIEALVKSNRGMHVEMIHSNVPGQAVNMIAHASKHLGLPVLMPELFTKAGHKALSRRQPEMARHYVWDSDSGYFASPKFVKKMYNTFSPRDENPNLAEIGRHYTALWQKMDKSIFSDPALLDKFFMLPRNWQRDETQGSIVRGGQRAEESQLQQHLGVQQDPTQMTDSFEQAITSRSRSKAQDMDGVAPAAETMYMRRVINSMYNAPQVPADLKKYLKKTNLPYEADRIGHFTKLWWSIKQLLWRNPHIEGLRDYDQAMELFTQLISRWHNEADDIAKDWERTITDPERKNAMSRVLFWLTEQSYRSPAEVAAGTNRHPLMVEFERKLVAEKFTAEERRVLSLLYTHQFQQLRGAPKSVFERFLDEVEQVSIDNINRVAGNPVTAANAIHEVHQQMYQLRSKPYFPIARFGKYSITARDPSNKNAVVFFGTYETADQRNAAVPDVAANYPHTDITTKIVPEEVYEFLGLPAPLIAAIRQQMPNLDPGQQAWLEEFERQHFPDRTFRKRWLPQSGIPGHSPDAFRTFAHYFMSGSRYLARLKYSNDMTNAISRVRSTLDHIPDGAKRQMIVDYMAKHHRYVMEGGKDWAKFKSFVALWQLGFSPAAAAMQLSQAVIVTPAYLGGVFGIGKGNAQMLSSMKAARNLKKGYVSSGYGNYGAARDEAIKQGKVDIGQAAELGSFSEGHNLMNFLGGSKAQKFYRNVSYYGMWGFAKMEQLNREITFHAAWELARKNPTAKKLVEMEIPTRNVREIADLVSRIPGFTVDDAVAFIFAKTVVDQTQGVYAPYARPAFMQHPAAASVLIFYQFTQLMTYVYRFNPGHVQLWLVTAAIFGMTGLPGADDLLEVINFAGKKWFGPNWDVKQEARKYIRDTTKGTIMDEVGPDLFLHGLSRYGFGLGLLPEGYGIGMFDASGNGSLGKIIPGFYEALRGINTSAKPDQMVADVAQRMAGAGFGWTFDLLQFGMENRGSLDGHQWEKFLPRTARAVAKSYRLATEGETTKTGAPVARFDTSDPEDLKAVIAQAIGFTPTKVSEAWSLIREQRDTLNIYKARREALYEQYYRAILAPATKSIGDVQQAIREYNNDVRSTDPSMQITSEQIKQSMRNRLMARAKQAELLPQQKSQIPVSRRIRDLYPGVKAPGLAVPQQ